MPRYFFRLEPDGFCDHQGEELPDDRAAAAFAAAVACELTRNLKPAVPRLQRLVVLGENDIVVHEEPLVREFDFPR